MRSAWTWTRVDDGSEPGTPDTGLVRLIVRANTIRDSSGVGGLEKRPTLVSLGRELFYICIE
jgi:hypothetical protein